MTEKTNQTQVYGGSRSLLYSGLLLSVQLFFKYVGFQQDHTADICLLIAAVFFGIGVLICIRPLWEYDEHGITLNLFFRKKKYQWDEVIGIQSYGYGSGLVLKDMVLLMAPIIVKDYYRVLKNVTEMMEKNNPKALVDELTRTRICKPPRFYL